MKSSVKVIIIVIIIGIILFGYSQYSAISQIGIKILGSTLLVENENGLMYNIELEFNNPSLLVLTAGKTEFYVISNDKMIGSGGIESFVLSALGNSSVNGTFLRDTNIDSQNDSSVKITGIIKYNIIFTSIDVPFVFYPTEEQAREFIHEN
ncbi:MAG: hypothetical protein CK527_06580 [Nitrosarchaeum sp.]|nr:hypothetical protein [Nitrosarchaeum sp.]PHY08394.1 MAG: hypothetical protein CK527_06580 [Nitrosarchaeum sp.]